MTAQVDSFHWHCRHTWLQSARNTAWCLLGCAIGDFGTILAFQTWSPATPQGIVLVLAIINGLLTSIALETIILRAQLGLREALRTALGMSLVSMIGMEIAMNLTDWALVGELRMTWWSVFPSLLAGFLTPWPYNYWRLKKFGEACH